MATVELTFQDGGAFPPFEARDMSLEPSSKRIGLEVVFWKGSRGGEQACRFIAQEVKTVKVIGRWGGPTVLLGKPIQQISAGLP